MSDTRFTIIGIGLIFAGFIVLGIFGSAYFDITVEATEFDDCFKYFDDMPPQPVDCNVLLQEKMLFSGLVIGLIAAGIVSLVKGVRGKWDQDVKPEDMVGPGGSDFRKNESDNSKK